MSHCASIFLLSICVLTMNSQADGRDDIIPINPLEKLARDREKLESLSFDLNIVVKSNDTVKSENLYHVWIQKNKVRFDKISQYNPLQKNNLNRLINCYNCEGHFLVTGNTGREANGKLISTPVQFFKSGDARAKLTHLNWRFIGVYPSGINGLVVDPRVRVEAALNYKPFFDNSEGHSVVVNDLSNGHKQVEIRYNGPTECVLRTVVDTTSGRTIGMTQSSSVYSETVEHKYDDNSQSLIPSQIRFHSKAHGISNIEDISILNVKINQFIDPTVFTISGFDLPDGTPIAYDEIKNNRDFPLWHNGKIDKQYTFGKAVQEFYDKQIEIAPRTPDIPPHSGYGHWLYLIGGFMLAIIGFALFWSRRSSGK
jgi:hypothetical protein